MIKTKTNLKPQNLYLIFNSLSQILDLSKHIYSKKGVFICITLIFCVLACLLRVQVTTYQIIPEAFFNKYILIFNVIALFNFLFIFLITIYYLARYLLLIKQQQKIDKLLLFFFLIFFIIKLISLYSIIFVNFKINLNFILILEGFINWIYLAIFTLALILSLFISHTEIGINFLNKIKPKNITYLWSYGSFFFLGLLLSASLFITFSLVCQLFIKFTFPVYCEFGETEDSESSDESDISALTNSPIINSNSLNTAVLNHTITPVISRASRTALEEVLKLAEDFKLETQHFEGLQIDEDNLPLFNSQLILTDLHLIQGIPERFSFFLENNTGKFLRLEPELLATIPANSKLAFVRAQISSMDLPLPYLMQSIWNIDDEFLLNISGKDFDIEGWELFFDPRTLYPHTHPFFYVSIFLSYLNNDLNSLINSYVSYFNSLPAYAKEEAFQTLLALFEVSKNMSVSNSSLPLNYNIDMNYLDSVIDKEVDSDND